MDILFSVLQFTFEFQIFPFDTFPKEDSDKLSVFSFKCNIKISFYATPLDASLKFLKSHHLCSIHGGFWGKREVGTRWRGCFHQRRIVPGWKSSQEYMMCFRRMKERKSKGWEKSSPVGVSPARDTAHEWHVSDHLTGSCKQQKAIWFLVFR